MKKRIISLSTVGAIALTASVMAADRTRSELPAKADFTKQEVIGEITVNGRTFHVSGAPERMKNLTTRASESSPITEAPGVTKTYCKDVIGYALGTPIQAYGVASYINRDGNDYYFYNIVTGAPMGTYVKGTQEGGIITLPMHQTVLEFEDEDYLINLGLLKPIFTETEDGIYVWFEYSDDYDSVDYTVDDKGTLELISPKAKYTNDGPDASYYGFPDYVIGYYYTDDYSWAGYCDVFQAYDEFNFERVVMPENLDMRPLTYVNQEGMGVIVYVGETDNTVYVKGLSAYAPDSVFKGELNADGTQMTVAPNQFIGVEQEVYFIITSTAHIENGEMEVMSDGTPVIYNIERDSEGNIVTIAAVESEYFLTFNDDPFYFYPMDIFQNLELTYQESFAGIPSTPQNVFYEDYSKLLGANYVFFELSSFGSKGEIIDVNNLYYSIYVNGEIWEFEEQNTYNLLDEETTMYYGIKEPTILVPYTFGNNRDLFEDDGGTFVVGIYAEGIDSVGVQAVYICDDVYTYSGLVTVDTITGEQTVTGGTDAGVETLYSPEEISSEYFNLTGHKVSHPDKGVHIKVSRMSDGSLKAVKILK